MTLYDFAVLLDVTHNFAFAPRNGLTWCNCYSSVFAAGRGVRLAPVKANDQHEALAVSADWKKIGYDEAVTRANASELVFASIVQPKDGHITPCVESPENDPTRLYVSAAGARNAIRCRLDQSFGDLSPDFFVFVGVAKT